MLFLISSVVAWTQKPNLNDVTVVLITITVLELVKRETGCMDRIEIIVKLV
jgi:hypothetical protein